MFFGDLQLTDPLEDAHDLSHEGGQPLSAWTVESGPHLAAMIQGPLVRKKGG